MRKRLIPHHRDDGCSSSPPWLDLAQLAQVEITSEDPAFPIEAALLPGPHPGWRAAHPGAQVIRLVFDAPHRLHHLHLAFAEAHHARTQEFVVQWSADGGQSFREIVRQQYHFSPPGTIAKVEDYPCSARASLPSNSTSCPTSRVAPRVPPCRPCVSGNSRPPRPAGAGQAVPRPGRGMGAATTESRSAGHSACASPGRGRGVHPWWVRGSSDTTTAGKRVRARAHEEEPTLPRRSRCGKDAQKRCGLCNGLRTGLCSG